MENNLQELVLLKTIISNIKNKKPFTKEFTLLLSAYTDANTLQHIVAFTENHKNVQDICARAILKHLKQSWHDFFKEKNAEYALKLRILLKMVIVYATTLHGMVIPTSFHARNIIEERENLNLLTHIQTISKYIEIKILLHRYKLSFLLPPKIIIILNGGGGEIKSDAAATGSNISLLTFLRGVNSLKEYGVTSARNNKPLTIISTKLLKKMIILVSIVKLRFTLPDLTENFFETFDDFLAYGYLKLYMKFGGNSVVTTTSSTNKLENAIFKDMSIQFV